METFNDLSKYSKQDAAGLPKYRLAVLGDIATQHLVTALKGSAYIRGLALDIFDADYDQILPQILDENSEMYAYKPNGVLIYMSTEKLYKTWCETSTGNREEFSQTVYKQISGYWSMLTANISAHILQFTFAEYDDNVFGSYACRHKASFVYQLRELNLLLMKNCPENVFLVDLCAIYAHFGRKNIFDERLYYIAKMPLALEALPAVASRVIDVIMALRGVIKKCVILDLDNTLWGGVIGDDGLAGIEIGELGTGKVYSQFQMWFAELKKRGIILAVCSKNEEVTAKEPFEKHDEMVLRLDDFAIFAANWEDKAANIRYIQETLNIGADSIIFIDDNPFERELVRSLIPEITVPELPESPEQYLSYLQGLNLFETTSISAEDSQRTEMYRSRAEQEALKAQYSNYDEYLQSLKMSACAAPFDEIHTPRISQLTQRSNQFNLRTIRYTTAEIQQIAADTDKFTFYFTLKDRLADHGLISVVIADKTDKDNLFISTWLMSCRVLRRGMEEFIINKVMETAKQNGYKTVTGEYIATAKNAMVANVYETLGFTRTDSGERVLFKADTDSFTPNKTYIKEQEEVR